MADLLTINTTTAAITVQGPTVNALDAIVFDGGVVVVALPTAVPTLDAKSLVALLVLLAAGGVWMARRLSS